MRLELVDPYSPAAERVWRDLACRSYFLTWGWVENWLACLPRDQAPRLGLFRDGDRVVAAGFLARRTGVRRHVVVNRAYHLNTVGIGRFDNLWIEYNGLAGDDLPLDTVVRALPGRWDELVLPGLRDDAFGGVREDDREGYRVIVERRVPSYHVDLAALRADGKPYLDRLSSQTRGQIRRAQRLAGPLELEVAADPGEAIAIYDELCALHAAQWRAKGQPGAFADPWFDRFHRRLIATRFAGGEIQLARARTAAGTLGCLYNFVWRGRVLQYQTGMRTFEDAKHKPGLVCHTRAIEHGAASGLDLYDMLGGDQRYKKSLSTGSDWLVWCKVQRPRLRFAIEDRVMRYVRARRAAGVAASDE